MAKAKYDEDAIERLIQTATGVARILSIMSCDMEEEDYAQSQAYDLLFNQLWGAVEDVTNTNPMLIGTRFSETSTENEVCQS